MGARTLAALLILGCSAAAGCATSSVERIPSTPPDLVVVKSVRLPAWTGPAALAQHSWFDFKRGGEDRWERLEVIAHAAFSSENVVAHHPISGEQARSTERWSHQVRVLAVLQGEAARRCAARLTEAALRYPDAAHYRAWPGPNSNSFVARLLRADPELHAELHHNAVGRDYTPLVYAGPSTTGSGLQLDTWLIGLQLGLEEGLELHLLQLTWGLDLCPPALKLPFLPRLGVP